METQAEDRVRSELGDEFRTRFGAEPRVFRAPGRVNLIGEHTDYNDGFVMPVAIEFATRVAIASRADRLVRVFSRNFEAGFEFDLDEPRPERRADWTDYVRGVAVTLEYAGHRLRGADLLIRGEVPMGSGLGSSAAIEVAAALALLAVSGLALEPLEVARLAQLAENTFVGMRCGIMDQFASCHGREGSAVLLDCRSLEYRLLALPAEVRLVIANTMVKHELASSEYNRRRADCEAAARGLGVRALRDATLDQLERWKDRLGEAAYRRARHIISENARVEEAAVALERTDLATFGRLMGESHRSLKEDYEVSCPELDLMVELAGRLPGVHGARMTGGGFGGAVLLLAAAGRGRAAADAAVGEYARRSACQAAVLTTVARRPTGTV